MTSWVHLSQIPEQVREALATAEAPYREEDARLEQATVRVLREERLRSRVPALIQAALDAGLTLRQALTATELHTGLGAGTVRRIYYVRRPQ